MLRIKAYDNSKSAWAGPYSGDRKRWGWANPAPRFWLVWTPLWMFCISTRRI